MISKLKELLKFYPPGKKKPSIYPSLSRNIYYTLAVLKKIITTSIYILISKWLLSKI